MSSRQIYYNDGSPSREMQDTNQLDRESCKTASVVGVRDRLNKLQSLVHVCISALSNPEERGQPYLQARVAEVLCDFVNPEIETAEEELRHV